MVWQPIPTPPPTKRQAWILAVVLITFGAILIAEPFGLFEDLGMTPSTRKKPSTPAPPWLATVAGCVFVFGGMAVLLTHYRYRIATLLAALIVGAGMVMVLLWSAFS